MVTLIRMILTVLNKHRSVFSVQVTSVLFKLVQVILLMVTIGV